MIRIRDALRALAALQNDPEDTSQVFHIIDALSGGTGERVLRRLRRSPSGRALLRSRRPLRDTLTQRSELEALPAGSVGRAYLDFIDAEGITSEGLAAASRISGGREAWANVDGELAYVAERMRDSHDLWHVVTGYRGDLVGEAALLAFTLAQTWNPGVGFIVAFGLLRLDGPGERREIVRGFRRGRGGAWLPDQPWETYLPLPLDQVRRRLRLGSSATYVERRPRGYKDARLAADVASKESAAPPQAGT